MLKPVGIVLACHNHEGLQLNVIYRLIHLGTEFFDWAIKFLGVFLESGHAVIVLICSVCTRHIPILTIPTLTKQLMQFVKRPSVAPYPHAQLMFGMLEPELWFQHFVIDGLFHHDYVFLIHGFPYLVLINIQFETPINQPSPSSPSPAVLSSPPSTHPMLASRHRSWHSSSAHSPSSKHQ